MAREQTERRSAHPNGSRPIQRFGLLIFGALLVVLFVVVALTEGIGDPTIPSGDVALVEGVPGDIGELSETEFEHAIAATAEQRGEDVPSVGDPKYDELKETAMQSALQGIWLQGLADDWGVTVSDEEVDGAFQVMLEESFGGSEDKFAKFVQKADYPRAYVDEVMKLQVLSTKVQDELKARVPEPSKGEIEAYYETEKATQFTLRPTRDVRLIVNKDKSKTEEARDLLLEDNSQENWKKVAAKYSTYPYDNLGGLQQGVYEHFPSFEAPLDTAIFDAPEGQIQGPIKTERGYTAFEVIGSEPQSVQELKAVEGQIKSVLAQGLEERYFTDFVRTFSADWAPRTFCAPGYVVKDCSNFKGSGHPEAAPEGCYEADPKAPTIECPAPVTQAKPALPGSVTLLKPEGEQLAQRPILEPTQRELEDSIPSEAP